MLHTHTVTPTHKVTETVERIVPNNLFTTNPADFQCDIRGGQGPMTYTDRPTHSVVLVAIGFFSLLDYF